MEQQPSVGPNPRSSNERQELLARAEQNRATATALVEKCILTSERHRHLRQQDQAMKASIADLRAALHGAVTDDVRTLRRLDVPPETTVILVKQLVEDPARSVWPDDLSELRRDVVTWAVNADFAA